MATTDGMVREALGDLDARLDHWQETLVALCRIPSVSAAGFPPEEVRRSASVQIPCAMIADLRKPNGALNVPGLYAKVARRSAKQLARIRKLPLSEAKFKKDAGLLPGVRLWGETRYSLLERQWTRPPSP